MNLQPMQNCFIKIFGDNQIRNISEFEIHASSGKYVNRQNYNLGYIINLESSDRISQVVQLGNEHSTTLGVSSNIEANFKSKATDKSALLKNDNRGNGINELQLKPLGSCENPIEIIKEGEIFHSTQNLSPEYLQQIAQALQLSVKREEQKELETAPSNIFYRVVYPDELNLKPVKPLKRGRRKKQQGNDEKDIKQVMEPTKLVGGFRTRSGRVTRPPQHIKNDFKKIDTSEIDSLDMHGELKTIDFESPSNQVTPDLIESLTKPEHCLEINKRKRSISSQYRCPDCKKAYLGNNKMLRHFEKHPDHRPNSDYYKARHDDTWNYLIDISNRNPAGQRGIKFCKELVNLMNNIRIVAQSFFKNPTQLDKNVFFVDDTLSNVLGINSGNYALNENKLHKEVQVLLPCSTKNSDNINIKLISDNNFDISVSKDSSDQHVVSYNSINNNVEKNANESNSTINHLSFTNTNNCFNLNCETSTKAFLFSESFEDNGVKRVKSQQKNKQELSLHNELMSDNCLLNSLPNIRGSVEELLLNNSPDSVMLDNSTSSDEVMNVDQFVNDRLKNLTESDLELPNSLNLDLSPLELFQFHNSCPT